MDLGQPLLDLGDVARGADAGDDVLALGVGEEVAAGLGRAGDLVAREGHPRARGVALVAEHHLLHIDRGAPVIGDPVHAAGRRPRARPARSRTPPGSPAAAGPGGPGEILAGVLAVDVLEGLGQLLQRVDVELGVVLDPALRLGRLDRVLETLARDPARDVAEHLHEAPVGVPGEALVFGGRGQPEHGLVAEPEVQHRVEHPRHRFPRAGADRNQQRILASPSRLPECSSSRASASATCSDMPVGLLAAGAHVLHAGLGGDREAGRHAIAAQHAGHLGDVRALAAQQLPHLPGAIGEVVDPLRHQLLTRARSYPGRRVSARGTAGSRPLYEEVQSARAAGQARPDPGLAVRAEVAVGGRCRLLLRVLRHRHDLLRGPGDRHAVPRLQGDRHPVGDQQPDRLHHRRPGRQHDRRQVGAPAEPGDLGRRCSRSAPCWRRSART